MRVLITTYGFPRRTQAFMENYVVTLASLGTEVCVAASALGDHVLDLRSIGPGSVEVITAPWTDRRAKKLVTLMRAIWKGLSHDPRQLADLAVSIHRRQGLGHGLVQRLYVLAPLVAWPADVLHLGWLAAAAEWMEYLPELDTPMVVSCHGSDLRIDYLSNDRYRDLINVVFERSKLVHCVSDELGTRAIELGADPAKVFVQPWGVDAQFFRPAPTSTSDEAPTERPRAAFRVVTVGRFHWVKGLDFALLAVRQLRLTGIDIEYTIIGNGDEKDRLRVLTTIRDLELDGCVILRGTCSPHEVVATLQASDAYLLASVSEGLNNSTLEAMAVGLPVVVTDVGGMREAVTDRINGLVVEPCDPQAIAAALLELATDSALRARLGAQARKRVADAFDIRLCAQAMIERYRQLATQGAAT